MKSTNAAFICVIPGHRWAVGDFRMLTVTNLRDGRRLRDQQVQLNRLQSGSLTVR